MSLSIVELKLLLLDTSHTMQIEIKLNQSPSRDKSTVRDNSVCLEGIL